MKDYINEQGAKFFTQDVEERDPELWATVEHEFERQSHEIELIASENIVSRAVMQAQGTVLTNKYAEGYPGRRYYGGCEFVDQTEDLARNRLKELFGCSYVNVQPNSGSQANQAAFMSLIQPGDTFLGLSLDAGGHLTHGAPVNMSGKWFNAVHYGLGDDGIIDMNMVEDIATREKPKLILAGHSAYSRHPDFEAFRGIADRVGAKLMVDMAHFAGLVAAGLHPSPLPYADVVTSTTHKTLRGPRGGIVLSNDEELGKKINSAVFPGLQGGPLMHVIAAKAVAFGEALRPDFKVYIQQVLDNAKRLAGDLKAGGVDIVSGGTDSHLMLVDLRPKSLTGKAVEIALGRANITCNKNGVPNDPQKPMVTSGIRLGTPAVTTRGLKEDDISKVAQLILRVIDAIDASDGSCDDAVEASVRADVAQLLERFPIYEGT